MVGWCWLCVLCLLVLLLVVVGVNWLMSDGCCCWLLLVAVDGVGAACCWC